MQKQNAFLLHLNGDIKYYLPKYRLYFNLSFPLVFIYRALLSPKLFANFYKFWICRTPSLSAKYPGPEFSIYWEQVSKRLFFLFQFHPSEPKLGPYHPRPPKTRDSRLTAALTIWVNICHTVGKLVVNIYTYIIYVLSNKYKNNDNGKDDRGLWVDDK